MDDNTIEKIFNMQPTMKPWGQPDISSDSVFLLILDHHLADAVTFLPPAMRASFHAQVGALIKLATKVCEINHDRAINGIEQSVIEWRAERARIAERTK